MKHTEDNPDRETNLMSKTTWVTVALAAVAVVILILAVTVPRRELEPTITNTTVSPSSSAPVESVHNTAIYYTIRKDVRRCAFPMCGGYFVRAVNSKSTKCQNGRSAADCYVAEVDWNSNSKVEPNRALLRGQIVSDVKTRAGKFGRFRVEESWQGAGSKNGSGEFYRVRDLRINCITYPCKTHHEVRLNSTFERDIAGVELNTAGAPDAIIQEAVQAMRSQEGILVSGSHRPEKGPAGTADTLITSQVYLRAMGQTASTKPCMKTGCSGQVCSDEEVITTCEYRTEYECYKQAKCERQANGDCGWTQTKELTSCLNRRK